MRLKEFVDKYRIDTTKISYECGVPYNTMRTYISGKHKPKQKIAEKIEKFSDNLVTVLEMRGKDDRDKRRERAAIDSNTDVREIQLEPSSVL